MQYLNKMLSVMYYKILEGYRRLVVEGYKKVLKCKWLLGFIVFKTFYKGCVVKYMCKS